MALLKFHNWIRMYCVELLTFILQEYIWLWHIYYYWNSKNVVHFVIDILNKYNTQPPTNQYLKVNINFSNVDNIVFVAHVRAQLVNLFVKIYMTHTIYISFLLSLILCINTHIHWKFRWRPLLWTFSRRLGVEVIF